jgi:hypothetical protein
VKQEWQRTTRVRSTISLQPDLLAAIRAHVEEVELGAVEAEALVCFETVSTRTKKPGLVERMSGGGNKTLAQAVIVSPTRLVWAQRRDDGEATAHSALLARIDVTDYEKSPAAQLLSDRGVEVHGIPGVGGLVGTLFFGLGEGPDADRARQVLKAAVKAAQGEGPPMGTSAHDGTASEGGAGGSVDGVDPGGASY